MKKFIGIVIGLLLALKADAQTHGPVRLALIPESDDAAVISDVLAAKLSDNSNIHLLERNEIDKAYRELGLSGGNKNYLKLGQILGADGLLLLESVEDVTNKIANNSFAAEKARTLNIRLVAVKPGVVLMAGHFSLLMKDLPDWSSSFVNHLDLFLPKLSVLAKDAIPLSVVDLRSAVSSPQASEMEQQLKTLIIQRLSQEAQLFVLERQKMQLLGTEKDLSVDESTFWNGAYLLDGVVDQNGFSKDAVTIDTRLIPANGEPPVLLHASGSRTNLAEVISELAAKVVATLQIRPTVKEWNAADEAVQYFDEAKWTLRWGMYAEAQAAAESAWALGKKDLDCAMLRIKTYMSEVPIVAAPNIAYYQNGKKANYVHINEPPDPKYCDITLYALKCYYAFSRNSPEGESKILWGGKKWEDWRNSDWYQLGIDVLDAASHVLQHYNYLPESQKPAAEKLAELRALARSVAELISKSPSVHDRYFVGDRIATHDELTHTIEENPNIFSCEVKWGCFWQERPEDDVALYHELMSSPVFCYIHQSFWHRESIQPRLIAWNEEDQKHIPQVWANFVEELNTSTNVLLRMEAQALAVADAPNAAKKQMAQQEWWNIVHANRDELVANNVELFYLGWGVAYGPETEAMDQEYWRKTIPTRRLVNAFDKQKQYLADFTPYNWKDFNAIFESRVYTKAQAAELQPLVVAYKSNLMAQVSPQTPPAEKSEVQGNARWVGFYLEQSVNAVLNPPAPVSPPSVSNPPRQTSVISQPTLATIKTSVPVSSQTSEIATNVLLVKKFLPIPLDGLPDDKISAVNITGHQWIEGKLALDFQYDAFVYSFDKNGNWKSTRNVIFPAIAILDPATEHWQVIPCPEMDITSRNNFYHHTTLCRGEVFTSDGNQIKKYDAAKNVWQVLEIPGVENAELFTVNEQLYAATQNIILEILDGGTRTHILASNRRQPPASTLDTENLGTPVLFAGPGHSLRAAVGDKIVAWESENWRSVCAAPQAPMPPVISDEEILFFADGGNASTGIWRLAMESDQVEFCLGKGGRKIDEANPGADKNSKPTWKLPPEFLRSKLPAAGRGPDLYLMMDHATSEDIVDEQAHLILGKKILPQDGYHAELLCFSTNYPAPQKIFLKFDAENASSPVTGDNHQAGGFGFANSPVSWFLFSTNYLFCGRETFNAIPGGGGDPRINQPQVGIWMIPLNQIDSEIARQKKAQREQQLQSNIKSKRNAQTLLEKYDRNRNGVIDIEEREDAMDDADFIKAELMSIDTNHNGWLDALELSYFDANQNKILDPKEQAGIDLAQHFFAESLLDQFHRGGKGWLLWQEYNEMIQSSLNVNANVEYDLQFVHADENHDQHLDLQELEKLLERRLKLQLQPRRMPGRDFSHRMEMRNARTFDFRETFKADVESYWQLHSVPASNQPRLFGADLLPNGSSQDVPY